MIENVYEPDRFIDVGIIDKNKFNQVKNTLVCNFSSGGISYCGYSHSGGLIG